MKRTLVLRREALAEITAGDLADVGGANQIVTNVTCPINTLPVRDCVVVDPPTLPPRCNSFPWCSF